MNTKSLHYELLAVLDFMWTGANEKLPVDSNCGVTIEHLLNTRVLDVHGKGGLSFGKSDNNLVKGKVHRMTGHEGPEGE